MQALLSRSLANWAAPAYVAATVLVVSVWVREDAGTGLGITGTQCRDCRVDRHRHVAGRAIHLPGGRDPFARTLGNRELAEAIRAGIEGNAARQLGYGAILTDDRDNAAALLYYGRDIPVPIYAWRQDNKPRNHFELERPFDAKRPAPCCSSATGRTAAAYFRISVP